MRTQGYQISHRRGEAFASGGQNLAQTGVTLALCARASTVLRDFYRIYDNQVGREFLLDIRTSEL
jgi:hypothetical protein